MQTLKTCNLDDEYKHVCFKDLEDYLKKDDLLAGYSQLEQEKIRQNLGIVNQEISVDKELNVFSENPVQNKAVFAEFTKKADIDKLPEVALSGRYGDLKDTPCYLPNPELLVVYNSVTALNTKETVTYDGSKSVVISMPTKVSQLENDSNYATQATIINLQATITALTARVAALEAK